MTTKSLPLEIQYFILKFLTASLSLKWLKAGYKEEATAVTTREQLLDASAELVTTGQDKPRVKLTKGDPAMAINTARSAGQARAGISGEPTMANCSMFKAVDSHEDGGCRHDPVEISDNAGGRTVMQANGGVLRESPGILVSEMRPFQKGAYSSNETKRNACSSNRSQVANASKKGSNVTEAADECGGDCRTSVMNEKVAYSQLTVENLTTLQYA